MGAFGNYPQRSLSPERMKGVRVPLVFLGRRDDQDKLENPTDSDWKPRNIGVLTVRGEAPGILGLAALRCLVGLSHEYSRVQAARGILARGRVDVTSVNFSREVDPDDLPGRGRIGRSGLTK
jgi:hypothetical protein